MEIGTIYGSYLEEYKQYFNENKRSSAKSSKSLGDWWIECHERYERLSEEQARAACKAEGVSFGDMLKSKYPGACYNVMDTSKIDGGLWGRNDYPWDAYFSEPADASVLDWIPSGAEPSMQDAKVQNKINSMTGRISIVISPELEEKMKNDPRLAEQVMDKVDGFIKKYNRPEANQGFLVTFDENGEINHVAAQGWAIDKDGGISKWSIVQKDDAKSHLQTMSENAEKIRKQNVEKRQEKVKIEEKRQVNREEKESLQMKLNEAVKGQFGDKCKGVVVINKDDENAAAAKADRENTGAAGLHMDLRA